MSVSIADEARPAEPEGGSGVSSGVYAMGALQRLALSLTVSLLLAAASWWALAG